jgi:hypothetical protein
MFHVKHFGCVTSVGRGEKEVSAKTNPHQSYQLLSIYPPHPRPTATSLRERRWRVPVLPPPSGPLVGMPPGGHVDRPLGLPCRPVCRSAALF